jgi:hypothetical protein
MAPLVAAAAWAIASTFTSFEEAPPARTLLVAGAWLGVALLPSLAQRPTLTLALAGIGIASAWARTVAPTRLTHEAHAGRPSRRFEAATLRVVLPLFGTYLALSCLTPWTGLSAAWSSTLGLMSTRVAHNADIYRALEQIAAFTLLGYAVAEYRGRSRHGAGELLRSILLWTVPTSAVFQGIRGWHPAYGASGLLFALTVLGAVGGGWIYILQLEHVRALARRGPDSAG